MLGFRVVDVVVRPNAALSARAAGLRCVVKTNNPHKYTRSRPGIYSMHREKAHTKKAPDVACLSTHDSIARAREVVVTILLKSLSRILRDSDDGELRRRCM